VFRGGYTECTCGYMVFRGGYTCFEVMLWSILGGVMEWYSVPPVCVNLPMSEGLWCVVEKWLTVFRGCYIVFECICYGVYSGGNGVVKGGYSLMCSKMYSLNVVCALSKCLFSGDYAVFRGRYRVFTRWL